MESLQSGLSQTLPKWPLQGNNAFLSPDRKVNWKKWKSSLQQQKAN